MLTATRPDDPIEPELDFTEYSGEDCLEDKAVVAHNSESIPEQDTLDANVQALLHEHYHVGDKYLLLDQLLLDQIQEDLSNDADTADAATGKMADIISGL